MKKLPKLIVILGATATGKTKLAAGLAAQLNGEIISADSRHVYRGMDIGTGKDLAEYGEGKKKIPYHLIDVADPKERFDLKSYQEQAYKAIDGVIRRGKLPILVGGSGLYLQAVVDGYSLSEVEKKERDVVPEGLSLQEIKNRLGAPFVSKLNNSEQNNKRRLLRYLEIKQTSPKAQPNLHGVSKPRYDCLVLGLDCSLNTIRHNIKKRLEDRFEEGMIQEVTRLQTQDVSWEKLDSFGLEYKFIGRYLKNELAGRNGEGAFEDMKEKLNVASGQFAKRQLTWFRRWEKQGREIVWLPPKSSKKIEMLIRRFLTGA